MNYSLITYSVKDRIATICLQRPEKRNAFNEQLVNELHHSFEAAQNNKQVKVVILKGSGSVFSAGADLAYLQKLQAFSFSENLKDSKNLKSLYQKIYSFPKITIAQIEGHAFAGGAGLATVCDFTFMVPEAKIGYTEVKIGFVPAIVMVFLLRKIGELYTKELLLTGTLISAQKAKEIGLINNCIEASKIEKHVVSFAKKLCTSVSSQSITSTKQLLGKCYGKPILESFDLAAEMNAKVRETEDCKKGIQAFLSKKDLNW